MNPQIWAARKAKKLSQMRLAELTETTQVDISRIENEGWTPPVHVRERLAEALEVPVDTLFPLVQDRA